MKGMKKTEEKEDARPVSTTACNTHCGSCWINSSEDDTWWCNPRPRIMEHRNLKDNTLSEQQVWEPERGTDASYHGRCFLCAPLSNILRQQQQPETHSGFIWTENGAFRRQKGKRHSGSSSTSGKTSEGQSWGCWVSWMRKQVIAVLCTLKRGYYTYFFVFRLE